MAWTSRALIGILATAVVGSTIAVATSARVDDYAFYDPIIDIRGMLETLYVEDPDDATLQLGAINGMIESLNDPYTVFVPTEDTAEFTKDLTGEYVGIGAEVGLRDGWFTILSPLDDSPAWRAGIHADDRVVEIDGQSTQGLSVDECIDQLMGEPGTQVTLTVERSDASRHTFTITRDQIRVVPVKGFVREDAGEGVWRYLLDDARGIAYIRLTQFTPNCAAELRAAIDKATADAGGELGGLILDLRFNPGGVLEQAVQIADMFLSEGTIVSTKGRVGQDRVETAVAPGTLPNFPLTILLNAQSASASEVLAGALSEHNRATIIGSRSFGKGLVQTVRPLPSGAGVLKITEQRYALPSGRFLQRDDDSESWGVDPTPGYYMPLTDEQTRDMLIARRQQEVISHKDTPDPVTAEEVIDRLKDPQLAGALAVLRNKVDNGVMQPVGFLGNTPDDVAAAELSTLRKQQDRLLRELVRLERRLEAAENATPESLRDDERDLWPDNTEIIGGTVQIKDADGHVVATLRITNADLERWLADAGLEPGTEPETP
jgi:carboxyl-terminal processing protease